MNENEARTLIERFAKKQQGGRFACPRCGKMSVEGKEYVVQDGDIMHFRFNV